MTGSATTQIRPINRRPAPSGVYDVVPPALCGGAVAGLLLDHGVVVVGSVADAEAQAAVVGDDVVFAVAGRVIEVPLLVGAAGVAAPLLRGRPGNGGGVH